MRYVSLLFLALISACSDPVPELLRAAAFALNEGRYEEAYYEVKQIRSAHPAHTEIAGAFLIATRSFKLLHHRYRHTEPDSVWLTSERQFMFEWLASHFEGADSYPAESVNQFFRGTNVGLFRSFLHYSTDRREVTRWNLRVTDKDNGIIREVGAGDADQRGGELAESRLHDPLRRQAGQGVVALSNPRLRSSSKSFQVPLSRSFST